MKIVNNKNSIIKLCRWIKYKLNYLYTAQVRKVDISMKNGLWIK